MPTPECLEERSMQIIASLNKMEARFISDFSELKNAIEERNRLMDDRVGKVENDVLALKLQHAEEHGKRSMMITVGSIALTALASILGAVGNAIYNWFIKGHGG